MKLDLSISYQELCQSTDNNTSIQLENQFFANVIVYFLIAAGFFSTFGSIFLLQANEQRVILDGIGLLIFASAFWLSSKIIKNEKIKMFIFSGLLFAVLIFTVLRFYYLIGPAVWTISFLLGVIILIYSENVMIINFSISNVIAILYMWLKFEEFDKWRNFYIAQIVISAMLFFAFYIVFKITRSRQQTIYKQFEKIFISEEKMYSTLLSVGDGVITVGMDGNVELINPIASKLTGWTQEMAQGQPIESVFKIVNEYTREEVKSPIKLVFETKEIVQLANHTMLISREGTESAIEDTAAPIKNSEGKIIGCILVFRDFSEKKDRQKHIEYLSFHDQLTGLYNRRYFEEEMERIDKKRNLPLTIIYGDVNGLKTINDAFGHDKGDHLIQLVADTLKMVCRSDDIIARVGGDEFIILLSQTDSLSAESLVSRIKEKLDQATIMDIPISASFGWDTKIDENRTSTEVLKTAENLMYQKKIQNSSSKQSDVIQAILNTMQIKWPEEEAHSVGVSKLCAAIGKAYQLSDHKIEELITLGLLHDIGKIAIDKDILNKSGKLSDSDWAQIKAHPETGFRLLGSSNQFNKLAQDVLSHQEKWDGTGYPKGLKGDEISWKARVLAVAETYDAMISERPYRPAFSETEVIAEIRRNAGTQFDPDIVKVFLEQVIGD